MDINKAKKPLRAITLFIASVVAYLAYWLLGKESMVATGFGLFGGICLIMAIIAFVREMLQRRKTQGIPTAQPQNPSTPEIGKKKKKTLLASIGALLVFILTFAGGYYLTHKGTTAVINKIDDNSKQDIIKQTVQEIKTTSSLPKTMDEVTTWTDIIEAPNAIRYVYSIHDADVSNTSNELLKSNIAPKLCATADTRSILDKEINMEYSYQVKDTAQSFFFSVSKADCL